MAQLEGPDLSSRDSGMHTWSDDIIYIDVPRKDEVAQFEGPDLSSSDSGMHTWSSEIVDSDSDSEDYIQKKPQAPNLWKRLLSIKGNEEDKSLGRNVDRRPIYPAVAFAEGPYPKEFLSAKVIKKMEEDKSLRTNLLPPKGSSQRGSWSGPTVKYPESAMKGNEEDKSLDRRPIYHAAPYTQGPRPDPKEFLSARVKKNKDEDKSLSTNLLPPKGSSQRGSWSGPIVKQSASGAVDHIQTKPGKTPFYLCAAAHSYPPDYNPYSMSSSLWTSSWRTCEFCSDFVDCEHWQPIEPTKVTAVDGTVKYRISVTRGSHECRVTGLRWQSFCNVELEYSLGDWDLYSDLLEKESFVPCGPLLDLRVISGKLAAVYLPHFLCLDIQHRRRDVRMLCADDTGVSLEDCLISQFHAVQFCHTLIPMGVLVSSGVPVKAHCDILIYLSSTARQTLHVYLIPGDLKMKESVEKRETDSVKICTWPDVSLQMKKYYTVSTSCSSRITPQKLKLRYTSKTPNFFKVKIKEVPKHSIDLQLVSEEKNVVRQAYIQSDIIQGPAVSESSPAVLKRSKGYETPVVKVKEKSEARSERAADQKKEIEASKQFGKWSKSSCRSCSSVQDTTEWKHIEPEADEKLHYRVSSSAGRYECSVSGLRWVTEGDVSLKYHFADWEPYKEDLRRMQFEPCGPLIDITVISGRIEEVHLPHFACLGSSPALNDEGRVLDVQDDGMFLEKCEITRFHAKLLHPTFSPKGFLIRSGFPVKVHCEVLIYQTLTALLTLHVYLVTCDPNIIQEVEKKEKDAVKILKPGPERSLPMKSWYKIKTKFKSKNFSSTIKPERLKLRYSPIKYCEVYTKNADDDFELHLINERKESIWDGVIRTDEYRRSSSVTSNDKQKDLSAEYAVWFVSKHRNALIKGVSLVNPIADDLNELIGEEKYSIITECKTPQKQMRKIYSFLCGGQEIKRKFYESLLRHEPHLVADLTGAN